MPAPLRPAATVLLLRDRPSGGVEVWLMERNRTVAFMASAWVFPGGRVEDADAELPLMSAPVGSGDIPLGFWAAAARELEEEAGVRIGDARGYDLAAMRPWAHWITPEVEPRRFDTWFFVAALPDGAVPQVDGGEAVNGGWFAPAEAIRLASAGELRVAPPTLRTLFELAPYGSVAAALSAERRTPPTCPMFRQEPDGTLYVLLPGDPDHPSEHAVDPPWRYVFSSGRWWAKDGPHANLGLPDGSQG